MLTELERFGDLGPIVIFRLEGTGEFLWKAPMLLLPREGNLVGQLKGQDEVADWYKVEDIRFEFDHAYEGSLDEFGNPVPFIAEREYFGVAVFVSPLI